MPVARDGISEVVRRAVEPQRQRIDQGGREYVGPVDSGVLIAVVLIVEVTWQIAAKSYACIIVVVVATEDFVFVAEGVIDPYDKLTFIKMILSRTGRAFESIRSGAGVRQGHYSLNEGSGDLGLYVFGE